MTSSIHIFCINGDYEENGKTSYWNWFLVRGGVSGLVNINNYFHVAEN